MITCILEHTDLVLDLYHNDGAIVPVRFGYMLQPGGKCPVYNIVFIMGESFKGRIFNKMLVGDTAVAPNIWKLANGAYFEKDSAGNALGGALWFKKAFSGGYPTVRGTMATYMGFPSHPNRDVPSFYAANKFKGWPEFLTNYQRAYVTVSNPIFDHTLPFIEKFFEKEWHLIGEEKVEGTADSLGVDLAIDVLRKMPADRPWELSFNTISSHIPFYGYPDAFAAKPDDAIVQTAMNIRKPNLLTVRISNFFHGIVVISDSLGIAAVSRKLWD